MALMGPVTLRAAEHAGFEIRDVESLREHYALTLRHWVQRLEARHEAALQVIDGALQLREEERRLAREQEGQL